MYETQVESEMDLVARITVAAGQIAKNPRVLKLIRQPILNKNQTCIDVGSNIVIVNLLQE